MTDKSSAYARAGVDIARAEDLLKQLKPELRKATRPEVIGEIGAFGGLFDVAKTRVKHPVLVSSTDSVGTKVLVASRCGNHRQIGHDIVHHACNDIAVMGAEPLYFLDYFAAASLKGPAFSQVLKSVAKACAGANVALIGGETAEMPGVYQPDAYDLVGTIVGVVGKKKILSGEAMRPGDTLIGLASSGLHTNGYSLARKIFFEDLKLEPKDPLPVGTGKVGAALLKAHLNYSPLLRALLDRFNTGSSNRTRAKNAVYAAAHITGGGIPGNLARVLPPGIGAEVDVDAWKRPALFESLAAHANTSEEDLHTTFNMGIGMVLVVGPKQADAIRAACKKLGHPAWTIGQTMPGEGVHLGL